MGSGAGKKYESEEPPKSAAPKIDAKRLVFLEDEDPLSPYSPVTKDWEDDRDVGPIEVDLLALYPAENFEITLYGDLQGLRPGGRIELLDFSEKDQCKELNHREGKCKNCDSENSVWHLIMNDVREVRVMPMRFKPHPDSKGVGGFNKPCYEGRITYQAVGATCNYTAIWLYPEWQAERYGWKRKPSKQASAPPPPQPEDSRTDEKKVVRRRRSSATLTVGRASTIANPELEEPLGGGFKLGDHVMNFEDKWAGEAVVMGKGANPGSLLIQFLNDGRTVSLPPNKLRKRLSRRPSVNTGVTASLENLKTSEAESSVTTHRDSVRRPSIASMEDADAAASRVLNRRKTVA